MENVDCGKDLDSGSMPCSEEKGHSAGTTEESCGNDLSDARAK